MEKTLTFIQITDSHLLDNAADTFYGINTKSSLQSVLSECIKTYPDINFILITGDISQTGSASSYTLFRSIVQDITIPIYCIPGNHDSPLLLQEIAPNSPTESINTINLEEFSLVLINSCVENQHYGFISENNMEQLKELLNNKTGQTLIIAIHHSPIKVNSKWLDELSLQNRIELINLLKHHENNIVVMFGHIHQEINHQHSNIHLISTPSTCHQFKTNSETMQCLSDPPPAFRYIELDKSGIISTKIHFIK